MATTENNKNSLKRKIAVATVGTLALFGAGKALHEANKPPTTNAAEVKLFENERPAIREGVLIIKSGANIRTTPERKSTSGGSNDPSSTEASKNIADFDIPEGESMVIASPFEDETGQFLGFTMPESDFSSIGTPSEQAEQTYWIDLDGLVQQDLASFDPTDIFLDPTIDQTSVAELVKSEDVEATVKFLQSGGKSQRP